MQKQNDFAPRVSAMRTMTRPKAKLPTRFRRRGQAIVEMALVSVVLIFLSMGIVQYGIIYNATIQLTNIAREGARFAAIHGTESNVESQVEDYIQTRVAPGTTIKATGVPDANIEVARPNGGVSGQSVTVTITYNMTQKFILPVAKWGGLLDTSSRWSQYKSTATMIIE